VGIDRLLQSSCCFLNTNTAIMRQLIQTARRLEAEWWQVSGEAWVQGQRKMSQLLGAFGLLDYTMLQPVLAWCMFWNLWTVYFFNFPNYFQAMVKCRYWICGYGGPPVYTGTSWYIFFAFTALDKLYRFLIHPVQMAACYDEAKMYGLHGVKWFWKAMHWLQSTCHHISIV